MASIDFTGKNANIADLEVGYYQPGSNSMDKTPKTDLKRGKNTDTFGPPNNWMKPVNALPKTKDDYYIPGTNK